MRSVAFWFLLAMIFGIAVYGALDVSYGSYDLNLNEMIYDNDSRWVYTYDTFIKQIDNVCHAKILLYAMPLFAIVTTVLILNRDFGDGYYEIEKAGGVKPSCYLFARLSALFTVNVVVMFVVTYFSFHLYTFARSMVEGMTVSTYLWESTIRLFRTIAFGALPAILFYLTLTYFIGTLCKSGIPAAVVSIGYVIANFAARLFLFRRLPDGFFDYMPATPDKIRSYFSKYDTDRFESYIQQVGVNASQVALAIGVIIAISALFVLLSYLRTRKRTI